MLLGTKDHQTLLQHPQSPDSCQDLLLQLETLVNNRQVFPQEFTQHLYCLLIINGTLFAKHKGLTPALMLKATSLFACIGKTLKREYLVSLLLTSLQKEAFLTAFHGLHAYSCTIAYPECRKHLLEALWTLSCFWEANQSMQLQQRYLHYSAFYLQPLSQQLDIKGEFIRWSSAAPTSILAFPWALTLERKALLLRVQNSVQMRNELQDTFFRALFAGIQNPFLVLEVARERLLQDTEAALAALPENELRKQLKVKFIGEEGVDEGGLQKEFFSLVTRALLHSGLFGEKNGFWWFQPYPNPNPRPLYQLAGKLVGLAMYNSVLLDIPFPRFVYKRLLGKSVGLEDLQEIDPALYSSLSWILNESTPAEWSSLALDWTCEIEGRVWTLGSGPLAWTNREAYVSAYVERVLIDGIQGPFDEFRKGFYTACPSPMLTQMLIAEEVALLVGGTPLLDFEEWRKSARYEHGYHADHPLILDFWAIVQGPEWTDAKRRKFLAFCTGSDRAPVGGLGNVTLTIARAGPDSDRLPSAHTCFNVLLLNEYSGGRGRLEAMLSIAVENYEGFGLI